MNCAITLCSLAAPRAQADRAGLESALLPDHTREEFEREAIRQRRRFNDQADRLGRLAIGRGIWGGIRVTRDGCLRFWCGCLHFGPRAGERKTCQQDRQKQRSHHRRQIRFACDNVVKWP